MIASSSSRASAFSIFAITRAVEPALCRSSRSPRMSFAERTNESATKSTPSVSANSRSREILVGQRRDRDRRARDVDALVRVHPSPHRDLAARAAGGHLHDLQVDEAVVDQNVLPGLEDLGEHRRADGQVSRLARAVAREDDLVAAGQHHRPRKVADAELRALQVGDERQRPAGAILSLAYEASPLGMGFVRAVREVEPRRVHPRVDELVEHLAGRGGGADRADDLRPTLSEHYASTLARAGEVPGQRAERGKAAQPG